MYVSSPPTLRTDPDDGIDPDHGAADDGALDTNPHATTTAAAWRIPASLPWLRVFMFENSGMTPERASAAVWRGLYELWRLSWFTVLDTNASVPGTQNTSRWVALSTWYAAVVEVPDPGFGVPAQDHLATTELAYVAGGLMTWPIVIVGYHWRTGALIYRIDPEVAIEIRNLLNANVRDQRLRPGWGFAHGSRLKLNLVETGTAVLTAIHEWRATAALDRALAACRPPASPPPPRSPPSTSPPRDSPSPITTLW